MLGRLNHVAIVVPDLAAATALYRDTMGATVSEAVDQPAHGVTGPGPDLADGEHRGRGAGRRARIAP